MPFGTSCRAEFSMSSHHRTFNLTNPNYILLRNSIINKNFMKKIFFLILSITLFAACKKESTNNEPVVTTGTTKFSGTFSSRNGYSVSGSVQVLQNGSTFSLSFNPFTVSSGPDLKIYLSKLETPTDFISLGNLKATSGSQSYDIPTGIDFTVHKYVLVHCQLANRVFAVAQLMP